MKKILEENERASKVTRGIVLGIIAVFVLSYLAMACFYSNHFSCNLYANNLHLTGMGIEEANRYLLANEENSYTLVIAENGSEVGKLKDKDIRSEYDYTNELKRLKAQESALVWFPYLTYERRVSIRPELRFSREHAEDSIRSLEPVTKLPDEQDNSVRIRKSPSEGYELVGPEDTQPDKDTLVGIILDTMQDGDTYLDLAKVDYNAETKYSEEQKKTLELFRKIDQCQNTRITFQDKGQEMTIDKETIAGFFSKDDEGGFITDSEGRPKLDMDRVKECAEEISGQFTTEGTKVYWKKFKGGTVSVNAGAFGRTVDTEALTGHIADLLRHGWNYTGPPDYLPKEKTDAKVPTEIGDTYIEVDMTEQKLYYIKHGRLFMESDVVTGCHNRKNDTPEGMNYIYFMQRNRTLVGPDYRTPVKYWMAFINHVGLHDANWRGSFGGEIYKSNGSHGCVNLPVDFAGQLYENVHVGMPVITYY
ncbi:MAG: L,D-transpeptidase/peptidoglycan binding protein [Lachnospiraceae bacterium]|nr:L,D-transpeptidase/peptidoglycan binding protein [Lachnospiraceae bacterium]